MTIDALQSKDKKVTIDALQSKDKKVRLGHRQGGCLMRIGLRMGRSGEIGCLRDRRFVVVYRRDE